MYYLPYPLFSRLFWETQEVPNADMYIAKCGWQDWMDSYDADTIAQTLTTIRDLAGRSFSELRKETGLSQVNMAMTYGFKVRTIENWESRKRTPPDHDRLLFSYVIFLILMNREGDGHG